MAFNIRFFPEATADLLNGMSVNKVAVKLKSLPQYDDDSLATLKHDLRNYNTYLMAESSIKEMKDIDFYEVSAVMDDKTCPVCRRMNGKRFKVEDRLPGVNFPPFCDNCRCSWVPAVEDWDKWMDDYVAKRGGDSVTTQKKKKKSYKKIKEPSKKTKNMRQRPALPPILKKWWIYPVFFFGFIAFILIYAVATDSIIIS